MNGQELIDEASFEYAMGDIEKAIELIQKAVKEVPENADGWLAMAEIMLGAESYDEALEAGEKALAIEPESILVHTTLSRIWVMKGDKMKAEHHGGQAKMLGWKEELKEHGGEKSKE